MQSLSNMGLKTLCICTQTHTHTCTLPKIPHRVHKWGREWKNTTKGTIESKAT